MGVKLSSCGCICHLRVWILQFLCFFLRKSAMFLRYSCFFALGMISTHLSLLDLLWKLSILFEFYALFWGFLCSSCQNWQNISWCLGMMDIFDELIVTNYVEVYFNKDVIILYIDAEKLNKLTSYFVDCICVWMKFCCLHWQIPALLMLLMISCGMLICQWAHL